MERRTRRWDVGRIVALLSAVLGGLTGNTTLLLAATVGLTFTVYSYATSSPATSVTVERNVDASAPDPGERVSVTVDVHNAGDESISDLRVFDDPPRDLPTVEGSPSLATSLAPGERERFEYVLRATRGDHAFGDTVVSARSVDAGIERRWAIDGDRSLSVRGVLDSFPPAGQTVGYTGRVPTDDGGSGIEFHSVREYHPEDPMNRVDWNRYARDGQLRTIEFREHRAASVVVLVDRRDVARRVRSAGEADATELSTEGAREIVDTLLDWNDLVGVAAVDDDLVYLEPDVGAGQRHRAHTVLADDGTSGMGHARRIPIVSGSVWAWIERLNDRLPTDTQVVFVSPLLDDDAATVTGQLQAHGHTTTVVSPDVTTDETPGGRIARIDRAARIEELRESGRRVIDWSIDEPLYAAVERSSRRWSG